MTDLIKAALAGLLVGLLLCLSFAVRDLSARVARLEAAPASHPATD